MSKKHLVAYVITKNGNKSYWNRIGVGFFNRDGSVNVKLAAFPVSGEFQLREYIPPDWEEDEQAVGSASDTQASSAETPGGDGDDDIPF